jgi:hypothetical protein
MDKIMETTRISYTVQQWPRRQVIGQVVGSATDCAQQEWRRRSATSTVQ